MERLPACKRQLWGGLPRTGCGTGAGAGAVEFAIVAPLLIAAYIGAFELSLGFTVARKVGRASSAVSDIVTQEQQVTNGLSGRHAQRRKKHAGAL